VAFDLDGLLADTEPLQFEAFRQTLAKFGIKLNKEEFIKRWITEKTESIGVINDYNLKVSLDELRSIKHSIYDKLIENVEPRPGAIRLVNELSEIVQIAVVSHSFRKDVSNVLKLIGLYDVFRDRIVAKEDVSNFKPHPNPYLQGAHRMKVEPRKCIAIEDAPNGVISAKGAGMYCIAVPNEFTQSLDFSNADVVVGSLEEISYNFIKSRWGSERV
jgi:HAD superfamily hydrolase (TIGR01509 family)